MCEGLKSMRNFGGLRKLQVIPYGWGGGVRKGEKHTVNSQ